MNLGLSQGDGAIWMNSCMRDIGRYAAISLKVEATGILKYFYQTITIARLRRRNPSYTPVRHVSGERMRQNAKEYR